MWIIKNEDTNILVHCSNLYSAQIIYFFLKQINTHCSIIHLTKETFFKLYYKGNIKSCNTIKQPNLFD